MKKFFIIILAVILSACASAPQKEYVTQTKTIEQKIPEDLLSTFDDKELIKKEDYLNLPPYQREEYLTNYILDLMLQLKIYKNQIQRIKDLNNESKPQD
jgi:uncharacterized protein YdeI (YjbR/CyaY-like superfamily)